MINRNEAAVRNAYAVAERKDLEGWISLFTPDGVFTDNSVGATYHGRTLADPVRNYGTAFSNVHRELYRVYADGNDPFIEPTSLTSRGVSPSQRISSTRSVRRT